MVVSDFFTDREMILATIYISIYSLLLVLLFTKKEWANTFKKTIATTHWILLAGIIVDVFVINLRGVLADRILAVAFLLTGMAVFSLYIKKLRLWEKLYFGLFLFYPIVIAITFLLDRILCFIIASPLLFSLIIPETKFSTRDFELREQGGGLEPIQIVLIKKGVLTEKNLGTSNDEELGKLHITNLIITQASKDSTAAIVTADHKDYTITFRKQRY